MPKIDKAAIARDRYARGVEMAKDLRWRLTGCTEGETTDQMMIAMAWADANLTIDEPTRAGLLAEMRAEYIELPMGGFEIRRIK